MTSDAGRAAAPLTAVGRLDARPPARFPPRRDDFGAFRAIQSGTSEGLALRPSHEGLLVETRGATEIVPWDAIRGLTIAEVSAGRTKVHVVSVDLVEGPPLDFADLFAAHSDALPLTLGAGRNALLRVERFRLFASALIASAGLSPASVGVFHRGPRMVPEPELAPKPPVLPRWALPLLIAASVAALMVLFEATLAAAIAVTAVLFLHEVGHSIVVRLTGNRVRGLLFVPGLGAATVPDHPFRSRWEEALVAFGGPVTALPIAGVAALLLLSGSMPQPIGRGLLSGMFWALVINLGNLLPILPLDGGRVLLCLTSPLPPPIRTALIYLPLAAVGAVVLMVMRPFVASNTPGGTFQVVGIAAFFLFCLVATRTALRRQQAQAWTDALPRSPDAVRAAMRDVTFAVSGRAREDVDGGVGLAPLTFPQTIVVLSLYVAEAVALFSAAAAFDHAHPGLFELFGSSG